MKFIRFAVGYATPRFGLVVGDHAVALIGGFCLTTDIAKATTGTLLPSRWPVREPLQKYHR